MAEEDRVQRAPSVIERFVRALVVTNKAVSLYPPSSNIPNETAREAVQALQDALQEQPELRLEVSKGGLSVQGMAVFPGHAAYTAFAFELYARKLIEVRFHSGADEREIVAFLGVLKYSPAEIEASGGFETRLWDLDVSAITVKELHVTIVDGGWTPAAVATAPLPEMDQGTLDELVDAAYAGNPREHLTVARFLGDAPNVTRYLSRTADEEGGLERAAERFAELAQIAYEHGVESERLELLRSLGTSLQQLPPAMRRPMLVDQVLPCARTDEAIAAVIRQLDIDSVCRLLVEDMQEGAASREGIVRAIRNLALISMADRQDVMSAAGAAMLGAGMDDADVTDVLELASPSRLLVDDQSPEPGVETPAETIFKLMDIAPVARRLDDVTDDPAILELREEARRGITDGDVVMALVSLVGLDPRDAQFASTMAILEDSLDLLIDRGDIDIAADSADALHAAALSPALNPEQRARITRAIARFSRPEDVRTLARTLRLYQPGSVEYEAAHRLINVLGMSALDPLVEQLADEPDMAIRKSLVDLLCQLAPGRIAEVGAYVGDARWYVVRNVVSVLGSTHSSAALPYLERTIRHPEARVRRETIRALSCVSDRIAHEMLIGALQDEDSQNVQLAARFLGAAGVSRAAGMLEQVAKGLGRGNRETGPRVEAIEALGRMGAVQAIPTLEGLAGKRPVLGASRARELRIAAESALARIAETQESAR